MTRCNTITAALIMVLLATGGLAMADTFEIPEAAVTPNAAAPGAKVLISCRVEHPAGISAIERVAADVSNGKITTSYSMLYDNGKHGDRTAGDGVFSMEIDAGAEMGAYEITFTVVDTDRTEMHSRAVTLTVR